MVEGTFLGMDGALRNIIFFGGGGQNSMIKPASNHEVMSKNQNVLPASPIYLHHFWVLQARHSFVFISSDVTFGGIQGHKTRGSPASR